MIVRELIDELRHMPGNVEIRLLQTFDMGHAVCERDIDGVDRLGNVVQFIIGKRITNFDKS